MIKYVLQNGNLRCIVVFSKHFAKIENFSAIKKFKKYRPDYLASVTKVKYQNPKMVFAYNIIYKINIIM